jgi:hypothetical protein
MNETASALARPDTKQIESNLTLFRDRANAIKVVDASSYQLAAELEVEGKAYIKRVGFELDPGIALAADTLNHLRAQKAKFVDPVKSIIEQKKLEGDAWKRKEREAAEAEARRKREELEREQRAKAEAERKQAELQAMAIRKAQEKEIEEARRAGDFGKREAARLAKEAAEQERKAKEDAARTEAEAKAAPVPEVYVKPSIPTVQGKRNQVNYKFEVTDRNKVQVRFLMPDEVAIGQKVRADKDPERSMREIGGVRCWAEG